MSALYTHGKLYCYIFLISYDQHMKSIGRVLLILLPMLVVAIISLKIKTTTSPTASADNRSNGMNIPFFDFKTIGGGSYTSEDVSTNTTLVIIHFNSECEYCDEKAQQIKKYFLEFENSELLFVSSEEWTKLNAFASKHHLGEHSNVRILQSGEGEFNELFNTTALPAILIYNNFGHLVIKIDDLVSIKTVIKYLRAANNVTPS
jgi:thioredoxin-related protein